MKENKEDKSIETKELTPQELKEQKKKDMAEWAVCIVFAVVFAAVINLFLIVNARIPSASMEPTIMTKDRIFGNRLAYVKNDPERGDIVIFKYPDDETQLFIKRVIGTPGDKVEIVDGKVYINDSEEALDESGYLKVVPEGSFGPFQVPEDAYFVMGDNRNNSYDSRYWTNSFVYSDKILGKAAIRYYPSFKKIQ